MDEQAPLPLRVAAVIIVVEAVGIFVFGIIELFMIDRDRVGLGITNAVFFCLYAAGLALCARGLLRLRTWGRSPALLSQLIQLGVAWSFRGGATSVISVLLAAPALAVLAVLFSPVTTDALYGLSRDPLDDDQRP